MHQSEPVTSNAEFGLAAGSTVTKTCRLAGYACSSPSFPSCVQPCYVQEHSVVEASQLQRFEC